MKILIFGGNGWIGKQFIDILESKNINYLKSNIKINIDSEDEIIKEIEKYDPTNMVSFIGRTHGKINDKIYNTIDYLEQEDKLIENLNDNLFAPELLCKISEKINLHYTYLGTGCIFTYKEDPFYKFNEDDKPNFFGSSYSIVKGYTDRIMKKYRNVLNLRIRMPIIGENNPRNFITKITKYQKICSIPNSMTVLPDLLPLIVELMNMKYTGTLNFTNPGVISHNEILELYKEHIDKDFKWENFTLEEQNKVLDSKRSNNHLDTTKLETLFPFIKNIKESLKDIIINYKI
jgi:3,5-epimerase/4-reductase